MARMLLVDRGLAPKTVNERVGRIKTIWTWLARRGAVPLFPTFERIGEPRRDPVAWSEDELRRIFAAVEQETLQVGPLPGPLWWRAWLAVAWNTAERVTAIMSLNWHQLDWASGTLHVPAEQRKRQTRDMTYSLWPETLATLREIEEPHRSRIFPWPYCWPHTFYNRYWRIIRRAGLQQNRRANRQPLWKVFSLAELP